MKISYRTVFSFNQKDKPGSGKRENKAILFQMIF